MEHQNSTACGNRALTRRLKVACQNVRLTDPVVGEKTIGSLCVGPILANQRNAFSHGAPDLRHQFAEPLVQALVGKAAARELAIKPCACFSVHWHRPRESVPDKESRSIPAMQQFMRSLSPLG